MFSEEAETTEAGDLERTNIYKPVLEPVEALKLTNQQPDIEANEDNPEVDNETPEDQDEACTKLVVQDEESTIPTINSPNTPEHSPTVERKAAKQLPRPVYWSIISVMVAVASIVIGMNGEIRAKLYNAGCFNISCFIFQFPELK